MITKQETRFKRWLFQVLLSLYLFSLAAFAYFYWVSEPDLQQPWTLALNLLLLSIPLVLLYGGIYLLLAAWRQQSTTHTVSPALRTAIHRTARLAAILIIFFTSLFSLDVFEQEASPLQLLGGFLVHNIPAFVMLLLLAAAWKRPAVGFAGFLAVALLFTAFFVRDRDSLFTLLLFGLPLVMVALLFYAEWRFKTDR